MAMARRILHLVIVWAANGIGGGLLVAFFNGAREPSTYVSYAATGLIIMLFIIGVVAIANRWMRPKFFPPGRGFRGSAVLLYTVCFLTITMVATYLSFIVLDRTIQPHLLSHTHAVTTTLLYILLFAALNLISTYAVTFYNESRSRIRSEEQLKARVDLEMRLAAEVQQALLPPAEVSNSRYRVAGTSVPSRSIGGDFFDHFEVGQGGLGFVLADVAGKGAHAALLAAAAQGMIRMACSADSPSATFGRVNGALARRTGSSRFVTAFHGVLSPDGRLRTSNAGHLPALVLRASGELMRLDAGGLPLGAFEDSKFEEREVQLAPGDKVVVFSDGVTEATGPDGQQFGIERTEAVLAASPSMRPPDLVTSLLHAVQAFSNGSAAEDDLTVLVVRYEG